VIVRLEVNGERRLVDLPPLTRLLDALRGPLGLTGTKEGCGEGECGSCTVLLDGDPVNACLVATAQCEGRSVTTVEGLGALDGRARETGGLSLLQAAFVTEGGAQCGICTPGMLIAAEALLRETVDGANRKPTDTEIREAVAGNICRCTGYQRIVDSIAQAAALRRRVSPADWVKENLPHAKSEGTRGLL